MKKMSNTNVDFGKRLKAWRQERKLAVEDVSREIGVSPSTYREWENGRAISGQPYLKLCQIFQVSLGELFNQPSEKREHLVELLERIIILAEECRQHL